MSADREQYRKICTFQSLMFLDFFLFPFSVYMICYKPMSRIKMDTSVILHCYTIYDMHEINLKNTLSRGFMSAYLEG